jgi:hypothetical protein
MNLFTIGVLNVFGPSWARRSAAPRDRYRALCGPKISTKAVKALPTTM